jgi:uncharacterized membrane protein
MNTTNPTDDILRRAMREELQREPTLVAESLGVFAGRRRMWNAAAAVVVVAFFAFAVYCAVQLLATPDAAQRVLWAVGVLLGMLVVMSVKVYFWLQMVRNQVLREIKRLELRLAAAGGGDSMDTPSP